MADTQGVALLKGVEKKLQSCDSFHLEYSINYGKHDISGRYVSKENFIVDFSKGNIFVKKSLEKNVDFQEIFMEINDEIYENIISHNNVRVYDINIAKQRVPPIYDPRIIHLTELWAVGTTIPDCLLYTKYNNIKSEKKRINNSDIWIVTIDKSTDDGNTIWEFWIEEPSFHVFKKICTTSYGMTYSVENKYVDNVSPFPIQTLIHREQNGRGIL
ncbi:MAG: hypothetical protein LBJ67_04490 [Planctomycetaceae bacterium]|jgi:hypothetical protein|nr:hypothetical protein [Planctomycetaceae bacterium]